jgi:YHS domain-containing protein
MARDPVCGREINQQNAPERSEYEGQTFYFCSAGCKSDFERDPKDYVLRQSAADTAAE